MRARSAQRQSPLGDDTIPPCLRPLNGSSPTWLLTPYKADSWIVLDTGNKPHKTIQFDVSLPNQHRLSKFPNLVDSIKRIAFGIRCGPLLRVQSGTVQAEKVLSLMTLARWMVLNEIFRFSDLTSKDQWEYAQLACGGVHEILNVEGTLSNYLASLANRIRFSPKDTPPVRRAKALRALPVRWNGSTPLLNRKKLLEDAGLGGIPIARCVCEMLDNFEIASELSPEATVRKRQLTRVSMDEDDGLPVTTEHIRRLLMPLELLYEHRRFLDDTLNIRPFQGEALKDIAKRLGSDIGRTATIPVAQAATMIERSIRWVLYYGPRILDAKDAMDDGRSPVLAPPGAINSEPANPFPLKHRLRGEHAAESYFGVTGPAAPGIGLPMNTAISFLATACSIVIAAFSARRAAEIVGLKVGCILRDESGNAWLRSFVHKTLQSDGTVPVPEIVAAAVSTLERLSARARKHSRKPFLFQYNLPGLDNVIGLGSSGVPTFRISQWMREFGYFVDVPSLPDGSRWTFRPHQFRRFFAVLYIWCYELSDFGALSYHLRHATFEHTRRYVSDVELGAIINHADRERTAQVLSSVALGNREFFGLGGERIQHSVRRISARLAQHLQVVPARKINQRITRFIDRTKLELRALPWGYCASPAAHGTRSQCTDDLGPADPTKANVATCAQCDRNIRDRIFTPYLVASLSRHRAIAADPASGSLLRQASEALVNELTEYLRPLVSSLPDGVPADES